MRAGSFFVFALVACGAGPTASPIAPRTGDCADFELDVERFWSRNARAEVRAGILKVGGSVDEAVVERVVTKMDSLSRDWVMMQESVCKDTLVRKVTPPEVYTKVSMCLRTALISQRTLVETMRAPSREIVYKSDDALAALAQDTKSCQKDAVYAAYAKAEEKPDEHVAAARDALGAARAFAALADRKRLADAVARGLAAAKKGSSQRLLVDLMIEDAERLVRFEANPQAARALADEIVGLAEREGYEAGIAHGNHERGFADSAMGKNAEALGSYMQALERKERVFGKDHAETARTINGIGGVHQDKGDYDLALSWFQRALEIRQRALGKDHPQTAASFNNVGNAYLAKGDVDAALAMYREAFEVKQRIFGNDHPSTATSYVNLGAAQQKKNAYDDALVLYEKALDIQRRVLGEEHPDTAATMNNIGFAYDAKGDVEKALAWYRRADAICTAKLGPDHARTARVRVNIDALCKKHAALCEKR